MADGDRGEDGGVDPLHPFGRCTCAGEGRCAWCQIECVHGKKSSDYCASCADEADALEGARSGA